MAVVNDADTRRIRVPIISLSGIFEATGSTMDTAVAVAALERCRSSENEAVLRVARDVSSACKQFGFFYIRDYDAWTPDALEDALDANSRQFFTLPLRTKSSIAMSTAGRAWRGYFPVGGELTSGRPDLKEGIYFGTDDADDDPHVVSRTPLFGRNLWLDDERFPDAPTPLRHLVPRYMAGCHGLGQILLGLIAIGLDLPATYFFVNVTTASPTQLFRTFHYPSVDSIADPTLKDPGNWGVGEHTDYGLLTLLKQDTVGGLQVRAPLLPHVAPTAATMDEWLDVPPIPRTLVINLGDMLETMTSGLFRSTPHRVRQNRSGSMRLSFPYFFDPAWTKMVPTLPLSAALQREAAEAVARRSASGYHRWDATGSTLNFVGRPYGAYLLHKVSKVFPDLATEAAIGVRDITTSKGAKL